MVRSPRIQEKALAWPYARLFPGHEVQAYRTWRRGVHNHAEPYRWCGVPAGWCSLHTPYRQRTRRRQRRH